ncbi:hypothetical protein VTO42DRAFT_4844 [Malbranchea cinnamomea]
MLQAIPSPQNRRKTDECSSDTGNNYMAQFNIYYHQTSSSFQESQKLIPVALLPRSRVSLSWLNPHVGKSSRIQYGRLFVARIPALERNFQLTDEPTVMAVCFVTESTTTAQASGSLGKDEFYVVERVKPFVYAVCALRSWVGEGELLTACKSSLRYNTQLVETRMEQGNWLERARLDAKLVNSEPLNRRKRMKVTLLFGPKNAKTSKSGLNSRKFGAWPQSKNTERCCGIEGLNPPSNEVPDKVLTETNRLSLRRQLVDPSNGERTEPDHVALTDNPTPEDLFYGLRIQYLEALYNSKTSVAYFAKGPLSRARAAFQNSCSEWALQLSALSSFYRDCVLPIKKLDMKYRDSVPQVLRNLIHGTLDHHGINSKSRSRKSKRKSVGKNALYDEEEGYIASWWRTLEVVDPSPDVPVTNELVKRLVADLRFREMQLQILLILEAMALDSTISNSNNGLKIPQDRTLRHMKTKKSQDLNTSLELLLDRLCIWHTVNLDHGLLTDVSKDPRKAQSPGQITDSGKLREFCTEVIMPFYAARIPDQCRTVVRKLGGPVLLSPSCLEATIQNGTSASWPGTSVKSMPTNKSRRTFQSVSTHDPPVTKRKVPTVRRSATTSGIPELKRESSESDLLSHTRNARGGIQKPKRLDTREVDLDTIAKQHKAKLRTMGTLFEGRTELDPTIDGLKKPSRTLVARGSIVGRATSPNHPSNSKNADRHTLNQRIQVVATPKSTGKKNRGGISKEPESPLDRSPTDSNVYTLPSPVSRPVNANFKGPLQSEHGSALGISSSPPLEHFSLGESKGDVSQDSLMISQDPISCIWEDDDGIARHSHNVGSLVQETPPRPNPRQSIVTKREAQCTATGEEWPCNIDNSNKASVYEWI